MGVSQNKQPLTEKDKEVASHLIENETIAEAQKQMCTAAIQPWLQEQISFIVCSDDTTLAIELSDLSIKP